MNPIILGDLVAAMVLDSGMPGLLMHDRRDIAVERA
jgi:hypothetical protein